MDPVCFTLGGRPIYWYGVFMALAFLAAVTHWNWLGRRQQRPPGFGSELAFWIMLAGIVGSRVAYVFSEIDEFRGRWLDVVRVDQGGLIFYGGFLGAILAVWFLAWRRGEPFWALSDFTISALPLGHALGRVGCFLNGCCYGRPTGAPWACASHDALRHPTQLYEAAANLLIYGVLLRALRGGAVKDRPGRLTGLYLMLYPPVRFAVEFLRGDPRMRWAGLSVAQWMSLAMFLLGAALWAGWPRRRSPASP
ncbi:MAG TPA: prolipoprotein diacylglyceryl transferase [Kiritimatiellia bacterium]|nr:prolipoprotein diacylglyceryl transferase [Kiritimatiellia bacterium]HRZ12652.1 prolipoprotein diacylglyceryl transferase [Kiritimatiellia bacterium]HSA19580.1 prolipoprotein diacylglyceryl transferase [Kiritimatiellia bacterium]